MGKKNKSRAIDASTSDTPHKRIKTSSPFLPRLLPKIKYDDMPLNHKRKFYLHDDCGTVKKYIEIITWLRITGCLGGSVFADIPNLNYCGDGYPLVEVEVITPKNTSAKFIICKGTLYLIAFYGHRSWMQFTCEYQIDGFTMLPDYDGSYIGTPWKLIGPQCMIDAVTYLAEPLFTNVKHSVAACQVFFVHLSEAARLYCVDSLVCKSLIPPNVGAFDKRIHEDEERIVLVDKRGGNIEDKHDVYFLVKGDGPVNFDFSIQAPEYVEGLIKKYSLMSKMWYVYSLSGKKCLEMSPEHVSKFHMRSRKSLRCTLAVLCNINLDKLLEEWAKKCGNHATVTLEVYKEMERQVRELQAQKKVLSPKTS